MENTGLGGFVTEKKKGKEKGKEILDYYIP